MRMCFMCVQSKSKSNENNPTIQPSTSSTLSPLYFSLRHHQNVRVKPRFHQDFIVTKVLASPQTFQASNGPIPSGRPLGKWGTADGPRVRDRPSPPPGGFRENRKLPWDEIEAPTKKIVELMLICWLSDQSLLKYLEVLVG